MSWMPNPYAPWNIQPDVVRYNICGHHLPWPSVRSLPRRLAQRATAMVKEGYTRGYNLYYKSELSSTRCQELVQHGLITVPSSRTTTS
jgi:hypothetical protein